MKLPKLIEILTNAASVCENDGEECELRFVIGDRELKLVEIIGEGTANFPTERGELAEFKGWQERLTVSFGLKDYGCDEGD